MKLRDLEAKVAGYLLIESGRRFRALEAECKSFKVTLSNKHIYDDLQRRTAEACRQYKHDLTCRLS